MRWLLLPATMLADRMRYPVKFGLVFALFLLPLLALSGILLNHLNDRSRFTEKERLGLEYITAVRPLLERIPRHRGMTNAYRGGETAFRPRILAERALIDKAFRALRETDRRLGRPLATGERVARLHAAWEALKGEAWEAPAPAVFAAHTRLIADLIRLVAHVADTSNLILEPELDSHYLMDAVVNRIPVLAETLGQARGLGAGVAARGAMDRKELVALIVRAQRIQAQLEAVGHGLDVALSENAALSRALGERKAELVRTTQRFLDGLRGGIIEAERVDADPQALFARGTEAIEAAFALFDAIVPALDGLLAERIAGDVGTRNLSLAIVAAVLAVLAYLFAGFYRSVTGAIQQLDRALSRLARGDLTARAELEARDETRRLAEGIDRMTGELRRLVGRVVESSRQLASSTEKLQDVAETSSRAMARQQEEIERVAGATEQMAASVQEVARSSAQAAQAAERADTEASGGREIVAGTVRAIGTVAREVETAAGVIQRLKDDSERIGKVLDVIRGIAEQTNLLALNAAIEAARAGEQGRGFAVVADEVRTLAQRTQESTHEIRQMIERLQAAAGEAVQVMESGRSQAAASVGEADRARESLERITQAVSTITEMNVQIASAAEEQSQVTEEINRNVQSISQGTQEAAAATRQTAAASEELARLASHLRELVGNFKI